MRVAQRIANQPAYFFAEVNKRIAAKRARGEDVISLGIGDPDMPAPASVVAQLSEAVQQPTNHRYPPYDGLPEFRRAIAKWYSGRFGVTLDPDREVALLLGSKEGIAHVALAMLDPGDVALVPNPGYATYSVGTLLAGGRCHAMPLRPDGGFLPRIEDIPLEVVRAARVLWLNYPNNPTGAIVAPGFFEHLVDFARRHDLAVLHDNAYSDVTYDGYRAPSFLETPGALDVGAEFVSFSKTYNMAGWRVGILVGNSTIVDAVTRLKGNIDTGMFLPVQRAGIAALDISPDWIRERNLVYQRRRDRICSTFNRIGWACSPPRASLYLWGAVPDGQSAMDFALRVLDETGVFLTPGTAFGTEGEGYFRASVTVPDAQLDEALARLEKQKRV